MKIKFAVILLLISVMESDVKKELNKIFLGFTNWENLKEELVRSKLDFSYQRNNLYLGYNIIEEIWHCSKFKYDYFDIPIENAELTISTYKNKSNSIKSFNITIRLKFEDSKSALEAYSKVNSYFEATENEVFETIESDENIGYFQFTEIKLNSNQNLLVFYGYSTLFDPIYKHFLDLRYSFKR